MIYDNILGTIGKTPIVHINRLAPSHVTMYVKCEFFNPLASVKDRLAIAIIEDAERRGTIRPGQTVVEATSGNTGITARHGVRGQGVSLRRDHGREFSVERRKIMRLLGAQVILTPAAERGSGMVRKAEELARSMAGSCARQFENQANPEYHRNTTGPEILSDFAGKRLDHWVTGWGTGGTLTGAGQMIARRGPTCASRSASRTALRCYRDANGSRTRSRAGRRISSRRCWIAKLPMKSLRLPMWKRSRLRAHSEERRHLCGISSGATFAAALKVAGKAKEG